MVLYWSGPEQLREDPDGKRRPVRPPERKVSTAARSCASYPAIGSEMGKPVRAVPDSGLIPAPPDPEPISHGGVRCLPLRMSRWASP